MGPALVVNGKGAIMSDTTTESGTETPNVGGVAADRLRSFVERIERLEEERAALTNDIRDVYAEAKGVGFDTKILRQVVRVRKMDQSDRREQEDLLELYLSTLGM